MSVSGAMPMAGNGGSPAGGPRESIVLITRLWDLECRHQLGVISPADYRRAVSALRSGLQYGEASASEAVDER